MNIDRIRELSDLEIHAKPGDEYFVHGISGCRDWQERIRTVRESLDNGRIQKGPNTGEIIGNHFRAHNGVSVGLDSYYGYSMLLMLLENDTVHEPQEERAFGEVLPFVSPGATMVELGSYWSFYSMWFNSRVSGARNLMVEPDTVNMRRGMDNFELNGMSGRFINAIVGADMASIRRVTVDSLMDDNGIDRISVLHSDIQGCEVRMLSETKNLDRIDYFFVSTHSNGLHRKCERLLSDAGAMILCSVDLDGSYSCDGLIVARHRDATGPDRIDVSVRG